ncbi:hypothetical protein KR767_16880 [Luteibacter anthropi]|uniref:MutS-related protein n=1 Tax=Luteibacter anthropi TaxID=564369 RepID=UPI0020329B14|nr:hypothetical protein [Luteibacter anthropi]URX61718.1 hypothetical protein KR767_16880 [Luteibacter anthropi]
MADLQLSGWALAIAEQPGALDIRPFLKAPAATTAEAVFRQGVFRDLNAAPIRRAFGAFLQAMTVYEKAATRANEQASTLELARYQLTAVSAYCTGVRDILQALRQGPAASDALAGLTHYLSTYAASDGFLAMANRASKLESELDVLRYGLRLGPGYVAVESVARDEDYAAVVAQAFARFRVDGAKDYRTAYQGPRHLNGLEERILIELADEHRVLFDELTRFAADYADPIDPVVAQVRSEVAFYTTVFDVVQESERLGQPWCLPEFIAAHDRTIVVEAADVALLHPAIGDPTHVVRNDLDRTAAEQLIVITGPNQAGKTTFARIWGQLHVLARVGCPVPSRSASIPFVRCVETHFERAELAGSQRGKLKDDLVRIHEIVERADPDTLVILNELFASTTTADAIDLSRDILERLVDRGATIVCVTFLWELAQAGPAMASWIGSVTTEDARQRTYRIRRGPPEGQAHTEALAASYGLTQAQLAKRMMR